VGSQSGHSPALEADSGTGVGGWPPGRPSHKSRGFLPEDRAVACLEAAVYVCVCVGACVCPLLVFNLERKPDFGFLNLSSDKTVYHKKINI
jgi:hypothetical protein